MTQAGPGKKPERLRGVSERPECGGERRYRAWIRQGKKRQVNLGLYDDRWLAAFAYNAAAEALRGDERAKNAIPTSVKIGDEQVGRVQARVRRRLGLEPAPTFPDDRPPEVETLLTLLEITIVGFWRGQVHGGRGGEAARELDVAARRLVEAAHALFWSRAAGHPTPLDALAALLGRRLDRAFRRGDLTREVLDDDGDDEFRVARWLVLPDELPGVGGFRAALRILYRDCLDDEAPDQAGIPDWASVLEIQPPFHSGQVREAYRRRSKEVHPDLGGSHEAFLRLQDAYDRACRFCSSQGS